MSHGEVTGKLIEAACPRVLGNVTVAALDRDDQSACKTPTAAGASAFGTWPYRRGPRSLGLSRQGRQRRRRVIWDPATGRLDYEEECELTWLGRIIVDGRPALVAGDRGRGLRIWHPVGAVWEDVAGPGADFAFMLDGRPHPPRGRRLCPARQRPARDRRALRPDRPPDQVPADDALASLVGLDVRGLSWESVRPASCRLRQGW